MARSSVTGDKVAAFGLTEPGAGSDVPNMATTAVKKGAKYVLNGTKQWIIGAGQADIYTVLTITNRERGTRGISCFIVEKEPLIFFRQERGTN